MKLNLYVGSRSSGLPWWLSGKEFPCSGVQSLSGEDPLEKEMATHSNILAWEIQWTEEPGGLQSSGSQRVRTRLRMHTHTNTHNAYMHREGAKQRFASSLWSICVFVK